MLNKKILVILLLLFFNTEIAVLAETITIPTSSENNESLKEEDKADIQKIVDAYKKYLSSIAPALREEIINYRKEIGELNQEKRAKYQKLSKEAQNYLKKEQEYKRLLPINKKKESSTQDNNVSQ